MNTDFVVYFVTSLITSITAWFLIRLESKPDTEKTASYEEELTAGESRAVSRRMILLLTVGFFIINTALAIFRSIYYNASRFEVINYQLITAVLWICMWTDIQDYRIPNRILLIGLLARIILLACFALLYPHQFPYVLLRCVISAAILFIIALLCRLISPKSIGFGDLKLLVLMGLYLGAESIWGVMFCSMAVAFITSLFLLITKRADRKTEMPFAPFLMVGIITAAFLTSF